MPDGRNTKFDSMNKGLIDLIPSVVEAVKQATLKKMELFSSTGKAFNTAAAVSGVTEADIKRIVEMVAAQLKR